MAQLHLLSPHGFRGAGVYAGIKTRHTPDIGLLVCETRAAAAAVFTTNKVFAAPVKVGREHIADGRLRAVVVNAGNANACTGKQGDKDAYRMCDLAAKVVGCESEDVLPSSTGIIGRPMPMEKVEHGILDASQYLGNSLEHALLFADAILTTDLKRKSAAVEFKVGKETITLAGVCKGSGMIGPRMALPAVGKTSSKRSSKPLHATMLAYLTTDAKAPPGLLRKLMGQASEASFNAVTVDDHTSTNDTAVILASGLGAAIDAPRAIANFTAALDEVCQSLAYQIAADGEGNLDDEPDNGENGGDDAARCDRAKLHRQPRDERGEGEAERGQPEEQRDCREQRAAAGPFHDRGYLALQRGDADRGDQPAKQHVGYL